MCVRVTAWRDMRNPLRGLVEGVRIDSTGASLKRRQRCDYCGRWTMRYDTVEHKPLHHRCMEVGNTTHNRFGGDWEDWMGRAYENKYVERRGGDHDLATPRSEE